MNTKTNLLIGIVVIVVIGFLYFNFSDRSTPDEVGQSNFTQLASTPLTNYVGESVLLSEFEEKVLVINSWAVWCPFCKKELPDFVALQNEFPNDIAVIAIDRGESLEKVRGFTDELGISNSLVFLMDEDDRFYKTIGGFSMPETIFLNEDRVIVLHKRGPISLEEMRGLIESIIQQ